MAKLPDVQMPKTVFVAWAGQGKERYLIVSEDMQDLDLSDSAQIIGQYQLVERLKARTQIITETLR